MSPWPNPSPATELGDEASIPLLTERIYLPAVELDTALPASLVGAPAAAEAAPAIADEARQAPSNDDASRRAEVPDEPEAKDSPEADDTAEAKDEATGAEAAIEVALDRDLVAAIDADFEALLSVEPAGGDGARADAGAVAVAAAELAAATAPVDDAVAEAAPPQEAAPVAEAAIEAQATALRDAVLQRVTARLPEQVSAAVRDLMQPAIDQAMARLGEEAEVALRIALQQAVEQALREELQQRREPPRS